VIRSRTFVALLASAAVAATAVVAGVALAGPANAVANGVPAQPGQYPFNVKLVFTNIPQADGTFYNSGCSGALIAPQWVIAAGHCFHDVNRNPVSGPVPYTGVATIGGVDDADPANQTVAVVEDYQSPTNDIAIAKLASAVTGIQPIALATGKPKKNEIVRIAGWGGLDSIDPAMATHLQTGQMKVTQVSSGYVGVVGYQPQSTTSACPHDSGAPYFFEPASGPPLLVSVESSGPDCPHDQVETTARVDVVAKWVSTTMAQHA
jgi:secreted trypsin-like serine protease